MADWIAITGSAGYIGSVLAKHCKDRGYNVLGCDRAYKPGDKQQYVDLPLACGYEDPHFAVICERYNIRTVFHLGGSASVPLSVEDPFEFYQNNVGNTSAMLRNLLKHGWAERDGHIVFSSTAAVYDPSTSYLTESSPKASPNPYGRSKFLAEIVLGELYEKGITSTVFRYFCVAGSYGDVGQPLNYPHIIPRIMEAAYTGNPLTVYGMEWDTPDGTAVRDYISVNDICKAHFHAVDYMKTNKGHHTFNMGTMRGTSVLELIKTFEDVIGIDVPYDIGNPRPGDPAILLCNPSKFIEETGFEYDEILEDMIKAAWDWYVYKKEETK
jgi:UDP-glucose 4-epimerase